MDATVSLFELETMTCLRTFSKFDHPARGVSFSADSTYIAYFAEGTLGVNIEKTFTGAFVAFHKPLRNATIDLYQLAHHDAATKGARRRTGSIVHLVLTKAVSYGLILGMAERAIVMDVILRI